MNLKILLIFSFIGTLLICSFHSNAQTDSSRVLINSTDTIKYTCPMHPEVISDKLGYCPKCGMVLIKMEKGKPETHTKPLTSC